MDGAPLRFVLDQGFPQPVFDVEAVDRTVEYVHLSSYAPELSTTSTPDWLVYLELEHRGDCSGVVTRDQSQISQDEELIALTKTRLSLVTWRKPVEDPIAEWGQLLAYMPTVRRRIQDDGPGIFLLPAPRLSPDAVQRATSRAHESASEQKVSFPELRSRAINAMRSELRHRQAEHLEPLLDAKPRKDPQQ